MAFNFLFKRTKQPAINTHHKQSKRAISNSEPLYLQQPKCTVSVEPLYNRRLLLSFRPSVTQFIRVTIEFRRVNNLAIRFGKFATLFRIRGLVLFNWSTQIGTILWSQKGNCVFQIKVCYYCLCLNTFTGGKFYYSFSNDLN